MIQADSELAKRRKAALKDLERLRRLPVVGLVLTDDDLYGLVGLPK